MTKSGGSSGRRDDFTVPRENTAGQGKVEPAVVKQAIEQYEIDTDRPAPFHV